jgi:hypothetical protein
VIGPLCIRRAFKTCADSDGGAKNSDDEKSSDRSSHAFPGFAIGDGGPEAHPRPPGMYSSTSRRSGPDDGNDECGERKSLSIGPAPRPEGDAGVTITVGASDDKSDGVEQPIKMEDVSPASSRMTLPSGERELGEESSDSIAEAVGGEAGAADAGGFCPALLWADFASGAFACDRAGM